MTNLSQRDALFDRIYEIAKVNKDVIIVSADMSAPALDKFRVDLPSQFVNVGIAEQNAILIASGLAHSGKKVFVYAIAPFITLRCLEQIRVNSAIMNIPINIVGMGTGLSYFNDGPTHHLIEDISIIRSLPNINIYSISDSIMASSSVDMTLKQDKSCYIRLDKDVTPNLYPVGFDFEPGIAEIKKGNNFYLISNGPMLHVANQVAHLEEFKKFDIGVLDLFKLPINGELFFENMKGIHKIITVEEHFLSGGLGSAVSEFICDNDLQINVKRIGINMSDGYKHCYKYGGREVIREHFGINRQKIIETISNYFC